MNFDQLMKSGQLYASPPDGVDEAVAAKLARCQNLLYDFNHTRFTELDRRKALLRELFAETKGDFYVEPPLYANWGCNVHIGRDFYANFHLTLVDDADIYFGDFVMVAPNVTIATAAHPIAPELREKMLQYNLPRAGGGPGMDWRRGHSAARGKHRGKQRHRRGKRGNPRHSRQRGGGGQPLPGVAPHYRTGPAIFPRKYAH